MDQHRRKVKLLCVLALTGITYSLLLHFQETLTGKDTLDGIIGVVFGLYMSSHPAAFMVDLLFFRHSNARGFSEAFSWFMAVLQPGGTSAWGGCHFYWNNEI